MTLAAVSASGCNALFGISEGKPRPICVDPTGLLIDDMEDGDGAICALSGRQGFWWIDSDSTSTNLTPGKNVEFQPKRIPSGTRGTSQFAAHFSGAGFTDWGAVMGVNLNQTQTGRKTVDASQTVGIKFSMKSDVPVTVRFDLPETEDPERGGSCVDTATAHNCYNHFFFEITPPGPDWVDYEVPFAAVQQAGGSATWNPSVLLGIQFGVKTSAPFDVWVDDLRFYYECGDPLCLPTCKDAAFPQACAARGRYPASCVPAGTDCAAIVSWCVDPLVIDDMEDGNGAICASAGRTGEWYTNSDDTSTDLKPGRDMLFNQGMIPEGRDGSHSAAHLTGSGFTGWGALMGMNQLGGTPGGYDASAFSGIKFWMKSNVPVGVGFPIPATISAGVGLGTCHDSAAGSSCEDHFELLVGGSNNEWLEYKVPFSALTQALGADKNANFVPGNATWAPNVAGIYFRPDPSAFDVWVDDIRFYACVADDCLPTCPAEAPVACAASATRPAGCWSAGTDCASATDVVIQRGVWAGGPDDVWSVGVSNTTWTGTISHWDGATWTRAATGTTGASPMLWSIWGSGSADVWAVGDRGTILRNSGSGWTVSTTGAATSAALNALWGSGTSDVWAVGAAGTIKHWNGSAWTASSSGTSQRLDAVWGREPNDVWAVGGAGAIVHWNGTTWSTSPSLTTSRLRGVWGSAANDVWAVGMGGTALHWNGSAWVAVGTDTTHDILAVWGAAADDIWAVGLWGTAIHWDGVVWTAFPSGTFQKLNAVWGSGPHDVWAEGYANTILHWDGSTWSASPP